MVREINTVEFNELIANSDKPVIVDFYAEWCGPCKLMAPIVKQVESENKDDIIVCKLNIEENPDAAIQNRVLSVPVLLFIKDGEIKSRLEGATTKYAVDQKIQKCFK